MFSLITRFKNELLNAALDLNSSSIRQESEGVITVTANLKPGRFFFAAIFVLPCLYYLNHVISNPGILNLMVAFVFCPALALMALLIGGTISRKSIDLHRQQTTKSLRLFSFSTEASEPLASQGGISLAWEWRTSQKSGGYSLYTISVCPGTGLVFSTVNDYRTARSFAEQLSTALSFPLDDRVPQNNRA